MGTRVNIKWFWMGDYVSQSPKKLLHGTFEIISNFGRFENESLQFIWQLRIVQVPPARDVVADPYDCSFCFYYCILNRYSILKIKLDH